MGGRFSLYKGSRKVLAKHKRRWVALPVAISVAAASPGLREAGSPAQSQTATTPDQAKRPATSETRPIPEAGSLAQPKSLDQVGLPAELARRAVLCDRQLDRVQQILIANRFGQELDLTTLHGPNRHRHIGVAADEDNRDVEVHGDELSLKVKAASPRQSDIEHKAGGSARAAGLEEFINRSEQLRLQPNGSDKAADRLPDCRIVIDDGRCRLGHREFSPEQSAFPRHPPPAPAPWTPGFAV